MNAAVLHQWIEIWNRNTLDVVLPIEGCRHWSLEIWLVRYSDTMNTDAGCMMQIQTVLNAEMKRTRRRTVLDRVSNILGAGWVNDPPGS